MSSKDVGLRIRVERELREAFQGACLAENRNASEVLREFKGAADGQVHPRLFRPGEIIDGELAKAEVRAGRAKAIEAAPRNKSEGEHRGPFPTGGASASSSLPAAPASPPRMPRRRKGARESS